ncbi:MAG: hypothetical protein AAF587_30005 [Bacteroidota bacterium]
MKHFPTLCFFFLFWLLIACIPTESSHGADQTEHPVITEVHDSHLLPPPADSVPSKIDYSGIYLVEETEFDQDSLAKSITPYYVELTKEGEIKQTSKKIHNYENLGKKWHLETSLASSILFVEGRYIVENPYGSSVSSQHKKKLSGTLSRLTDTTLVSNFDIIVSIEGIKKVQYQNGSSGSKSFHDEIRLKRKGIWHKVQ